MRTAMLPQPGKSLPADDISDAESSGDCSIIDSDEEGRPKRAKTGMAAVTVIGTLVTAGAVLASAVVGLVLEPGTAPASKPALSLAGLGHGQPSPLGSDPEEQSLEAFAPGILHHETGGPPGMDPPRKESSVKQEEEESDDGEADAPATEKSPLALAAFGGNVVHRIKKKVSDLVSGVEANHSTEAVIAARTNSGGFLHHYALPCWDSCGSKAGPCDWCGEGYACCRYLNAAEDKGCGGVSFWPVLTFYTCVKTSAQAMTMPESSLAGRNTGDEPTVQLPTAPRHRFYVYRAVNNEEWPFGNINVGNLAGTMWYLANEVLPRCPKRYNITRIKRILIETQASPQLFAKGMNFGIRYSMDAGKCTGSNTRRLGPCSRTWEKYGHVPGCNNFKDHYPWPIVTTTYPDGIWYDLPMEGRCTSPTGGWNCTWSQQPAGQILLEEELESKTRGLGYCCHGQCTRFWNNRFSYGRCRARVQEVMDMFAEKYPEMPRDLPPPPCDFDRGRFWS